MLIELRGKNDDRRALLSVKPASLSVSLSEAEVYTYDLEGRLLTAWVHDQTYVRALSGRVVKKWRDPVHPAPWKRIQELETDEAQRFVERLSPRIKALLERLER